MPTHNLPPADEYLSPDNQYFSTKSRVILDTPILFLNLCFSIFTPQQFKLNPTTYKLAKMNLTIRGIDAKIELGDTLMNDKFPELKVDYVIANPPFNVSDYNINKAETNNWKYGIPPTGNANYAWLQHFISKLASDLDETIKVNLKKIGYTI